MLYSKINDEKGKKLERGELTRPQLFRERFDDFFKHLLRESSISSLNRPLSSIFACIRSTCAQSSAILVMIDPTIDFSYPG